MTDVATTVDTYLSAYNEVEPAARRALLDEAFAADACLIDPPLDGQGVDGIHTMMGIVHEHYPKHTFRRTSGIEEHHGFVRYGWELLNPDGGVALSGMDVGELDAQGRLVRVTGFFEPLPELS